MLYCHNTKLILLQFYPSLKVDSKTRSGIIHVGLSFNAHRSRGSGAKSSGCIARGTRPVGGASVNIATYHINIHWNMGNLRTIRRSELT